MPLLPAPYYLAKNPTKQSCTGFKKVTLLQKNKSLENCSFNDFLNAGNQFPDGTQRWNLIRSTIHQALYSKVYYLNETAYVAYQVSGDNNFMGIVGCIPASELNQRVTLHERVLAERVSKFAYYLKNVKIQAEPTLLAFRWNSQWQSLEKRIKQSNPSIVFEKDNAIHQLWHLPQKESLAQSLFDFFEAQKTLYLVDGHHRRAAISELSQTSMNTGLLSYCIPHTSIKSHSYVWFAYEVPVEIKKIIQKGLIPINKKPSTLKSEYPLVIKLNEQWYKLPNRVYLPHLDEIKNAYLKQSIPLYFKPMIGTSLNKQEEIPDTKLQVYYQPFNFNQIMEMGEKKVVLPAKSTYLLPKTLTGLILQSV